MCLIKIHGLEKGLLQLSIVHKSICTCITLAC